jgi:enoyl-CoA hydratase
MKYLIYEHPTPSIGVITLTDPTSRNAMGENMASEFAALTAEIGSKADQPRVLIVTGAGGAFSSGGNLEMLDQKRLLPPDENRRRMLSFYRSFLGIRSLGIPLIAAINGAAVGAGLCLACGCDIRIASTNAKLGLPFSRLGLYPGMGSTYLISALIGQQKATELLLTGRIIGASEALAIGLVSEVTEPDNVLLRAIAVATETATAGPVTIKNLLPVLRNPPRSLDEALIAEAAAQAISYASDEFAEGVASAREKRPAVFR